MHFVERILQLMSERNVSAYRLSKDIGISDSLIGKWDKNRKTEPSAVTLHKISEYFQVTMEWLLTGREGEECSSISNDELQLIQNLRMLPIEEKYRVLGNVEGKAEIYAQKTQTIEMPILKLGLKNHTLEAIDETREAALRKMNISKINQVAAGTAGQMLQEQDFEKMDFPEVEISSSADFGVLISGDSMEPEYSDGEIAWVKSAPFTNLGEVGIYSVDGHGYIKQHGKKGLISLNKKYPPIVISEDNHVHTFGRVIGKTSYHIK